MFQVFEISKNQKYKTISIKKGLPFDSPLIYVEYELII